MFNNAFSKISLLLFFSASCLFSNCFKEKKHYDFSTEPIDVVIPCCKKDLYTLDLCIQGIKENGKNIRRIIVISSEALTSEAEWFDEKNFPFTKYDLALEIFHSPKRAKDYISSPQNRMGWIYQQLLKLYAYSVIPDISSNILILDSDTIFLNPTEFINDVGGPLFTTATEYNTPYFEHGQRLLPGFRRVNPQLSGISHHMLFQGPILEDLFDQIMQIHQKEPWIAICNCINTNCIFACISEYEIYFNFTCLRTDQAKFRQLCWSNVSSIANIENFRAEKYSYIACHEWMRPKR